MNLVEGGAPNAKRIYLVVYEGNAERVSKEKDDLVLGVISSRSGNIGLDTTNCLCGA